MVFTRDDIDHMRNGVPQHSQPPCVILFNGFPGVGKYTIAQAFKDKMETIPTRLVDNHTIIDPVEALIPGRNTAHDALRKQFRGLASEALKNTNEDGLVIILAACLAAGSSRAREHFQEYVELATARGEPLVVGRVVCDESANKKRVCSEERKKKGGGGGGGETKLAADRFSRR